MDSCGALPVRRDGCSVHPLHPLHFTEEVEMHFPFENMGLCVKILEQGFSYHDYHPHCSVS